MDAIALSRYGGTATTALGGLAGLLATANPRASRGSAWPDCPSTPTVAGHRHADHLGQSSTLRRVILRTVFCELAQGCLNSCVNKDERHLLAAIDLARRARDKGNHPFGALLVDPTGEVLLEAENSVVTTRDCTGHAETNLMRMASDRFDAEFLAQCTLYASTEPCAMCSGAIYWGGVRRVVFGLSQETLGRITNSDPELPIPCREILARGKQKVEVAGPFLEDQARAVVENFSS